MIKVFLSKVAWSGAIQVYVVDRDEINGKSYLLQFGKHNISFKAIGEHEANLEPSFSLPEGQSMEFLKAMAEAASTQGIKLESDLKRDGKLEATEKHLEDMRKLVFFGQTIANVERGK